ncbi:hypothetical protein ABMY26_32100 [Azospirillum sp. HJ39]|uniref:hypothetical protein n=1 Tax=Azospirillum sp. HJ39 TaxID=3159496 RepID=UPI0035583103
MTHIAPTAVASSLDALAVQIQQLAKNPSQQAAAQTAALADRFSDLARMLRAVDYRRGVWLGQAAETVRSRSTCRPFVPYSAEELVGLAVILQTAAGFARKAVQQHRPSTGRWGGGDAA